MRLPLALLIPAALAAGIVSSCSGGKSDDEVDPLPDATTPDTGSNENEAGNLGDGGTDGAARTVRVTGRVLAPEGTIPINGALVYLTPQEPAPIPTGKFCDVCTPVPEGTPYDLTKPDGTFSMKAAPGRQYVVVQKGAFRRVRSVNVKPGTTYEIPEDLTTLPGKYGLGDTIPKMAIIPGVYDHLESTLAKMGLGQVNFEGHYVRGSGSFDVYEEGADGGMSQAALFADPAKLDEYQIIFRPCSTCNEAFPSDPTVMENLKKYVEGGGKLYVTDYLYEYVNQGWPDYVTFQGEPTHNGGCVPAYTVTEQVADKGLSDWLTALGVDVNTIATVNGSYIDAIHTGQGPLLDGGIGPITPKVWMQEAGDGGAVHPNTISFEHGCGRVMYATYDTQHTIKNTLSPQELALFYVLLEVNVCSGPPIPPPPPD